MSYKTRNMAPEQKLLVNKCKHHGSVTLLMVPGPNLYYMCNDCHEALTQGQVDAIQELKIIRLTEESND